MKWRVWVSPILAAISAIWCVIVGGWIWFTPVRYSGIVGGFGRPDQHVVQYRAFSEISHFGPLPLIIPTVLAILATWAAWRGRRVGLGGSALFFAGFTIIAGFSIGGAYLPAAGSLILATLLAMLFGSGKRESGVAVLRALAADGARVIFFSERDAPRLKPKRSADNRGEAKDFVDTGEG
jgi:hypothetical protein